MIEETEMKIEDLQHKDIWNGKYRNIKFEIVKWYLGSKESGFPCWNYYLYLLIDQIPLALHEYFILDGEYRQLSPNGQVHLFYNYSGAPYISNLDWHGGITFYEKHLDGEGKLIGIKVGCDYAHFFDKGADYFYTIEYVLMECKQTIDKLQETALR